MSPTVGGMIFVGLAFVSLAWYKNSPEQTRQRAADRAEAAKEREPRFYKSSDDGCRVYRFKEDQSGRWIYFTRCDGSQTSTRTTWQECRLVGKVTVCEDQSQTVENNAGETKK